MKITNSTSFDLIAFGWHDPRGYGDDVRIASGATADVSGPYLGMMGGGECYVALSGEIVCHEGSDTEAAFHIARGEPLYLGGGDRGVTVRHFLDTREEVIEEEE